MKILRVIGFRYFCWRYKIPKKLRMIDFKRNTTGYAFMKNSVDDFIGFCLYGEDRFNPFVEVRMRLYFSKSYRTKDYARTAVQTMYKRLRNGMKYEKPEDDK